VTRRLGSEPVRKLFGVNDVGFPNVLAEAAVAVSEDVRREITDSAARREVAHGSRRYGIERE